MVTETATGSMHEVAVGQRLMIIAIIVNIVAYVATNIVDPIVGLIVAVLGLGLAIVGIIRATTGLGFSTPRKAIYVIGLLFPLVALIVLAVVSQEATKTLKANGYKVGFFGAKGP